jgi:hypothetical protein
MRITSIFTALALMVGLNISSNVLRADDGPTDATVGQLVDAVNEATAGVARQDKPNVIKKVLCKKASLFSAKISLRSLDGNLCRGPLGLTAWLLCKKYSDGDGPFTDSSCAKRIMKDNGITADDSSVTVITNALVHALKDTASIALKVAKPIICAVGPVALDLTGVGAPLGIALGAACGAL